MPQTTLRLIAISALLALVSTAAAETPPWPEEGYVRQLVEKVLPESSSDWDGYEFALHNCRGATYIAAGLLWRDAAGDREAAADVLRGILELQYDVPSDSKLYGVWRTRLGETKTDSNWREFVGCGLILILEDFRDRLPHDLAENIEASLLRAAEGDLRRNVGPAYTNIALMSAFLLDYVGAREGRQDIRQAGLDKAQAIYELFSRHKTFDEFNSPTYYGPDLMALALWRRHAPDERLRRLGRQMEADLWRDLGAFYHAGMKNMCGPFVRAYGMDMTRYCALAGLWIALAVGDPALSPWPAEGGDKEAERVYAPVFALLGVEAPDDVLPGLKRFAGTRTFEREFGKSVATVRMEPELMMGAAMLSRRWEQHHPATIYWQPGEGKPVGWILLTGMNENVAPRVVDRRLEIRRTADSDEPIEFLVFAPGLGREAIGQEAWSLPGLRVAVDAAEGVRLIGTRRLDHARYGRCLEIRYATPEATSGDTAALTLRPEK